MSLIKKYWPFPFSKHPFTFQKIIIIYEELTVRLKHFYLYNKNTWHTYSEYSFHEFCASTIPWMLSVKCCLETIANLFRFSNFNRLGKLFILGHFKMSLALHPETWIHYLWMNECLSLFTQTCVNTQGRSYLEA